MKLEPSQNWSPSRSVGALEREEQGVELTAELPDDEVVEGGARTHEVPVCLMCLECIHALDQDESSWVGAGGADGTTRQVLPSPSRRVELPPLSLAPLQRDPQEHGLLCARHGDA